MSPCGTTAPQVVASDTMVRTYIGERPVNTTGRLVGIVTTKAKGDGSLAIPGSQLRAAIDAASK